MHGARGGPKPKLGLTFAENLHASTGTTPKRLSYERRSLERLTNENKDFDDDSEDKLDKKNLN